MPKILKTLAFGAVCGLALVCGLAASAPHAQSGESERPIRLAPGRVAQVLDVPGAKVQTFDLRTLILEYAASTGREIQVEHVPFQGLKDFTTLVPDAGVEKGEDLLRRALYSQQLVLIDRGEEFLVVPFDKAHAFVPNVDHKDLAKRHPLEVVKCVIPVASADVTILRTAVAPLHSRESIVAPVQGLNALIVCDLAMNVQNIVAIAAKFDEGSYQRRAMATPVVSVADLAARDAKDIVRCVIPCGAANAKLVAGLLNTIPNASGGGSLSLSSSVNYIESANCLLVFDSVANVREVVRMVSLMDANAPAVPLPEPGGRPAPMTSNPGNVVVTVEIPVGLKGEEVKLAVESVLKISGHATSDERRFIFATTSTSRGDTQTKAILEVMAALKASGGSSSDSKK